MPIARDKFAATARVDRLTTVRLGCHCPTSTIFPRFKQVQGLLSRCSEGAGTAGGGVGCLGSSREAGASFPDQAGPSRSINVERAWSKKPDLLIDGG
jgi:hypothetical protein